MLQVNLGKLTSMIGLTIGLGPLGAQDKVSIHSPIQVHPFDILTCVTTSTVLHNAKNICCMDCFTRLLWLKL